MKQTLYFALFAACSLATSSNSAFAQSQLDEYSSGIPDLGIVNELQDVSDDGRAILGQPVDVGFTYLIKDGNAQTLSPGNYSETIATVLSGDGRVAAGNGRQPFFRAITWTDCGDPVELPLLPGTISSQATAINADGSIVVGFVASAPNESTAIRWVSGVANVVPTPTGASEVVFTDIAPDGSTMVGNLFLSPGSTATRAVRWSETAGYSELEFPAGATRTTAEAQSADGSLVVGSITEQATGKWRAAMWDASGAVTLVDDPAWFFSEAIGIDHVGSRILLRANGGFLGRSHLYDVATGVRTTLVDELALTGGPTLQLDDLLGGLALSGDGSAVVGNAYVNPSGESPLWRVRINSFGTKVCGTANSSSALLGGSLLGSGSLSVSRNSAVLTATLLPPEEFGLFLASQTLQVSTPVGSSGILCLGGDIGRFVGPGQIGQSTAGGTLSLSLDLGDIPQPMGSVAGLPGETWYFQAWFRDRDPLLTSNFTDALSVMLMP